LFTYICSLASNEKQTQNRLLICFGACLILFSLSCQIFSNQLLNTENLGPVKRIIKLVYLNSRFIYLYLFIYLLLTLTICINLSKKKEGAIRIKKYYENT